MTVSAEADLVSSGLLGWRLGHQVGRRAAALQVAPADRRQARIAPGLEALHGAADV